MKPQEENILGPCPFLHAWNEVLWESQLSSCGHREISLRTCKTISLRMAEEEKKNLGPLGVYVGSYSNCGPLVLCDN